MNRKLISAITFFAACFAPTSLLASTSYEFTGKVTRVGQQSITVQNASETREFDRSNLDPKTFGKLEPGQSVTVWYTLEATKLRSQEAGSRDTGDTDSERLKKGVIRDDRVYMNADNSADQPRPRQS